MSGKKVACVLDHSMEGEATDLAPFGPVNVIGRFGATVIVANAVAAASIRDEVPGWAPGTSASKRFRVEVILADPNFTIQTQCRKNSCKTRSCSFRCHGPIRIPPKCNGALRVCFGGFPPKIESSQSLIRS